MHDITLTPPSKEMLVAAHQSLGDRKLLFNTSGQSYRAMGAAAVKALSDEEAIEALAADGQLIKRPFVDCLLYTSPSPRDRQKSRMPSSA